MKKFRYSRHAEEEMKRRQIPQQIADQVLTAPEQELNQADGRKIYQSRIEMLPGKTYLIRIFIDPIEDPAVVVTVYRTSKIEKYWRNS